MDSGVHRAFPRKRLKKTTNCTGTHVQPRPTGEERDPCLPSFLPSLSFSAFHPRLTDDHLQLPPSFNVYVLPSRNQFSVSLCVYSRLTEESRLLLTLSSSSLHLLPLLCNQFSLSPFMILFHSYKGFQGQPSFFFSLRLFVLNKATAREQLVLR